MDTKILNIAHRLTRFTVFFFIAASSLLYYGCSQSNIASSELSSSASDSTVVASATASGSAGVKPDSSSADSQKVARGGGFWQFKGKFEDGNIGQSGTLLFEITKEGKVKGKLSNGDTTLVITGKVFVKGPVHSLNDIINPLNKLAINFASRDSSYQFSGEIKPGIVEHSSKADLNRNSALGSWTYCPPCVYDQPRCMIACRKGGVWKAKKIKK